MRNGVFCAERHTTEVVFRQPVSVCTCAVVGRECSLLVSLIGLGLSARGSRTYITHVIGGEPKPMQTYGYHAGRYARYLTLSNKTSFVKK